MTRLLTVLLAGSVLTFAAGPGADAQARGAPIAQGVTSGEAAATVERLRAAMAEQSTQIAALEAERARTTGRIETLEFLLSETNDELNRLRVENGEIGNRLQEYEDAIAALSARVASLETASSAAGYAGGELGDDASDTGETVTIDDQGRRVVRRTVTIPGPQAGAANSASTPQQTPNSTPAATTRTVTATTSSGSGLPEGSLGTIRASQLPGESGALFSEAKSRLLRFDYDGAEEAFDAFLTQFGDDPQAGEARYWMGEVLYQQGAYAESGATFTEMLRAHPDDERAPDALVKLARSLRLIGESEKACAALAALPKRYPNASSVTQNIANVERVRSACEA